MRNTQKGFTLVELIVVITILAILGTIAFISLGSYTADARNAKRSEQVGKLASAVDNGTISGTPIMAFVTQTGSEVTAMALAGSGGVDDAAYNAGTPNASALNISADQFLDPQTSDSYVMGVTSLAGASFQVSSIIEDAAGVQANVIGSYNPRAATGSTTADGTVSNGRFSIDGSSIALINFFKTGDIVDVTDNAATTVEHTIAGVSVDGQTITFSSPATNGTGATMVLTNDESDGLIGDNNGNTTATLADPVIDGSTTTLPY